MPITLPQFSRTINQAFTDTWYEMKSDIVDNVLTATPLTAALTARGVFKQQSGGDDITENVGYGTMDGDVQDVEKGDKLVPSDPELDTTLFFRMRNWGIPVRRTLEDDVANRGKFRVKDYLARRIEAARDALAKKLERDMLRTFRSGETNKGFFSLNDIIPPAANRASGTFGRLNRCSAYIDDPADPQNEIPNPASTTDNPFWAPRYRKFTEPVAVNLETDMRAFYNTVADNFEGPDLIVTTKALIEQYEEYFGDRSQMVVGSDTSIAKLGFQEFYFKQASLIYSTNVPTSTMFFLTTQFLKFVYDDMLWGAMSDWVELAGERAWQAHIIFRGNLISNHLRRQGRMYRASVG